MPSQLQLCVMRDRETGNHCGRTREQHKNNQQGHTFRRGGSAGQEEVPISCMYCGEFIKRKDMTPHIKWEHIGVK